MSQWQSNLYQPEAWSIVQQIGPKKKLKEIVNSGAIKILFGSLKISFMTWVSMLTSILEENTGLLWLKVKISRNISLLIISMRIRLGLSLANIIKVRPGSNRSPGFLLKRMGFSGWSRKNFLSSILLRNFKIAQSQN